MESGGYIPRRFASRCKLIYPPLFTSPLGDSSFKQQWLVLCHYHYHHHHHLFYIFYFFPGIQVPSNIPSTIFNGSRDFPPYILSSGGWKTCLKILCILSHMHPDVHYAPLIPPLASLFLHFMDEDLCYACLSALMNSRRSLLDQSQRAVALMAKTFQDALKSYSVSWMFVIII